MALLDYMGDAPGFLSYRRTPQTNVTNIPARQKPVQQQFSGEQDLDLKANPGDKQYLYDQTSQFNAGVQDLFKQYGGEMDWVVNDPKYKQLAQQTRWEVYDRQAAEQNKANTDDRLANLRSLDSGQHNDDFELVKQGNVYVPKDFSPNGGFLTKGQYTQEVIANPQLQQREDGTLGVKHVEFDYGTGNQKSFHSVLDNIYAGDSRIGVNSSGTNQTDQRDTSETANLKYAVGFFHNEGYKSANNYQQVNDATQYLIDYGFDDAQKYYLWQSFYKDVEQGKPFKTPRMDENGYVRKSDGSVIMDDYYVAPEDLQNPDQLSQLFNGYVTDRVIDYSEKFKKKESENWRTDKTNTENINPDGSVVEPETGLRRWEGVTKGYYPKNNAISENVYTRGSKADIAGAVIYDQAQATFNVLDNTNFPAGMDQASTAIVGKDLDEFGGNIFVGGRWISTQDMGLPGGVTIGNVLNVREIPMYSRNADGTVSTMSAADAQGNGAKVTWGATVRLYADDDSGLFESFKFVNPVTGQSESVFFGDDVNPAAATQGIAGFTDRTQVTAAGYPIHGDEGTSWYEPGDHEVQYIDVVIPIEDGMLNFDEYEVGETRKAESEQIQTSGSKIGTLQGLQQEQNAAQTGVQISRY